MFWGLRFRIFMCMRCLGVPGLSLGNEEKLQQSVCMYNE